jgi:hypothetical protein
MQATRFGDAELTAFIKIKRAADGTHEYFKVEGDTNTPISKSDYELETGDIDGDI